MPASRPSSALPVNPSIRPRGWLPAAACLAVLFLAACSQQGLLERTVPAATADDLAAFRVKLAGDFPAEALKPFDTALQELKLDAMNNGVAGVARREERMRASVNGKSVREALVLGYQARHRRVSRELKDMSERLEHDRKLLERPAKADSTRFLTNLVANERDLVAQLERELNETDAQLAAWGAKAAAEPPGPASPQP